MTWGLKFVAGKGLKWLFPLKRGRDQESESAHVSGPFVLLGKDLRAVSLSE